MELICGDLDGPCPRCDGAVSLHVAETIEGYRVIWTVTSRCDGCGRTDEMRERPAVFDNIGNIIRQALIARVGLTRLQADPDENRELRLRSLTVFRKRGATITGAADTYAAFTSHGLTGTPAEMAILADQLTAEGIRVTLQPNVGFYAEGAMGDDDAPDDQVHSMEIEMHAFRTEDRR